jgi:peroxiredoxin
MDRILMVAIVLLAIGLAWTVAGTLQVHITEAGDTAPNFSIVTEHGRTVTRSDFGGKILALNFWATWCPPCLEELPSMNEFARQYASQGVVVIGISVDKNQTLYKRFLAQRNVVFDTARDPDADIANSYGTFVYPETYIIGRDGKVLEKTPDAFNWMDPQFLERVKFMVNN